MLKKERATLASLFSFNIGIVCSTRRSEKNNNTHFAPDVFAKRVNREISKQTAAAFWAHKRNKRGMKKYLKEITTREQN